jgi:hypothetical protein
VSLNSVSGHFYSLIVVTGLETKRTATNVPVVLIAFVPFEPTTRTVSILFYAPLQPTRRLHYIRDGLVLLAAAQTGQLCHLVRRGRHRWWLQAVDAHWLFALFDLKLGLLSLVFCRSRYWLYGLEFSISQWWPQKCW